MTMPVDTEPDIGPVRLTRAKGHLGPGLRVADDLYLVLDDRLDERVAISRILSHTEGASPTAIADMICAEIALLRHRAGAAIISFTGHGAVPLSSRHLEAWRPTSGRQLPPRLARRLRKRAEFGPWLERLTRDEEAALPNSPFSSDAYLAYAPITRDDDLIGLFVLGTTWTDSVEDQDRRDKLVTEALDYAAIAGGLLAKHLSGRADRLRRLAQHRELVGTKAFTPVFQPIIDLADGHVVGYEALTRFNDGTSPEVRFQDAVDLGRGTELEVATLGAAVRAAASIPRDQFLCLNVSPDLIIDGSVLGTTLKRLGRKVVLEITEHQPVDDYAVLRDGLERLRPMVQLSIDDAGAGFASLRHILELRPDFVKLDRYWVHSIEEKLAHQALIAGMVHFAQCTGTRLVAEGIENEVELDVLREIGVELGQGFHLGGPCGTAPDTAPPAA
jgi:EAL domain-containing protein (putative c-di-GMP-specific phosphodiesterase class I)